MKKHKESHTKHQENKSDTMSDHKINKCHFCSKIYTAKQKLREHIKKIHEGISPEKKAICNLCGKTYLYEAKLKVHIDSAHKGIRHFCDQCGKLFVTEKSLKAHIFVVHEKNSILLKCEECSRKFAKLYTHCKDHIKTCEKCGYTTSYNQDLKNHQNSSNCMPDKLKKTIKCGKCSSMFTTINYMQKHELSHTIGKLHKCNNCGVGFSARYNIKKHKKKYCKGI